MSNQTLVTEFILWGFSEKSLHRILLFILFFSLYMVALCGNSLIMAVVTFSSRLHTPLYFFLANLAVLDVVCACTVIPKLLETLVAKGTGISYRACMTQMYFLTWSVAAELLLFTAMAYDRYVAICQPLHYSYMMSPMVCATLAGTTWGVSMFGAGVNTCMMLRLAFCGPNVLNHFICEIPPLLLLSCSSTFVNDVMTIIADIFFADVNFLLTMVSYGFIIETILKIRTMEGKRRAFSTCSSHLIVVTMYYSTVIYAYLSPNSSYSPEIGKVLAVLYSIVSPALNPLIYTFRNKDVKVALKKMVSLMIEKL
nr:olfactory receptor 13A1-like [Cavia porcellus]